MALITCSDVALGYEGHIVTEGLDFSVEARDNLYIVGENGAGKSTLLQALLRLHHPLSGSIRLGEGLQQSDVGYLPQQTQVQKDFPASVREVVRSGFAGRSKLRPFLSREEKRMAADNMEKLGVARLSNRCFRELSGGQQQRVLLARALCAAKRLLLLDELTAGLDPVASRDFYDAVERLNKENGIAVVMVSHDIAAAVRYASHILHLGRRQLFFGTREEYLSSDIGSAYARAAGGEDL